MISRISAYWWFGILVLVKVTLHLLSATTYEFHRDEFLYLVQSEHMAWGYLEVPPMIAVLGWLARMIGGDSQLVIKLFPLASGLIIMGMLVLITRELGGKSRAQFLAVLTYLVSPMFLRTNHLFQPVTFNHLWWVVLTWLVIRLIKTERPKTLYWAGVVAGLGFLTKYSILFFLIALITGLIISKYRKMLWTREMLIASAIFFMIAAPNILWQYTHNFPVVVHMRELTETQLVNVRPEGFLVSQFLMQFAGSLVWFAGLLALLFSKVLRPFRYLGYAYLVLIVLLLALSGKDYYTGGIYPLLFAAGGVWYESVLKKKALFVTLSAILVAGNTMAIPYGIPILPIDRMQHFCAFMKDNAGLSGPLRWEDGKVYALPQDYADMHGWKEMASRVSSVYHQLPDSLQPACNIFGGSYAHASTLTFYRHRYDLPEVYSLTGSHLLWIPDSLHLDRQILVDESRIDGSEYFRSNVLVDSTRNPYARDPGYIYYRTGPKMNLDSAFAALVERRRSRFRR